MALVDKFQYRVTDGWLRDLASEPTPTDRWPCTRWDDALSRDQVRFLDVQAQMDIDCNVVWGLFVDRNWPAPFENVISEERVARLAAFVGAAHQRGVKVLSGLGVYSWGFEEVIRNVPEVGGGSAQAMCLHQPAAWDWMRRVLDFLMEGRWGLDGVSMQSADQGRCPCERCSGMPVAEYHEQALVRTAEYIRRGRPEWVIGQAAWGLQIEGVGDLAALVRISQQVDYMVEVREHSARTGRRREIVSKLKCAFGSVGGVFLEPPQHWDRRRWFVPCGLTSAGALKALWADGGRACEYFYRPFANPGEEVSWRTGAAVLADPGVDPQGALQAAIEAVYAPEGGALEALTKAYTLAERAYFSRSVFQAGDGSQSLEPLVSGKAGDPVYLIGGYPRAALGDYARELSVVSEILRPLKVGRAEWLRDTLLCIEGTLRDIEVARDHAAW